MLRFNQNNWLTPNTYDNNFSLPKGRGVYLLAIRKIIYGKRKPSFKILYVGMSENLRARLKNHEVLRELQLQFDGVVIFFQNRSGDIRSIERRLIACFNPPFNIVGRRRGV